MDSKMQLPTYNNSQSSQKDTAKKLIAYKLFAAVAVVLGLAAIAGLCAVVVVTRPGASKTHESYSTEQSNLEDQAELHSKVLNSQIFKRQAFNPFRTSCTSEITNDSIPIARIEGRGHGWGTVAPSGQYGYITNWRCNRAAFVNGGLNFTQDDQRLYFPTCGYYYISSQVYFQYYAGSNEPNQTDLSVHHGIEIRPNCETTQSTRYRYGHSSLVQNSFVPTSTFIGDVVKMCKGGSIRVFIPSHRNLCCARGDGGRTHFSTFLIEKTDCM